MISPPLEKAHNDDNGIGRSIADAIFERPRTKERESGRERKENVISLLPTSGKLSPDCSLLNGATDAHVSSLHLRFSVRSVRTLPDGLMHPFDREYSYAGVL
jgi:hypothetical protein